MTLQEIIVTYIDDYNEMRRQFMVGEISTELWIVYSNNFLNMILESDDIRTMFERMKNDQRAN